MTDPDKLAAFKALAGDLGASMKDKVIKQGEEAEQKRSEARALQERLNVEREKMLRVLENDIDALGWDQMPKAYAVSLAEDGTEMLNLIEDLPGDPIATLMRLATTGELKNEAVALVVTNESYQWPDYLMESIKDDKRARKALWKLLPPNIHPLQVEGRQITLVDRTGQALCISRLRDTGLEPVVAKESDVSLVNAMKCLLGIDRRWNHMRDTIGKSMTLLSGMMDIFHQGHDEIWTEDRYIDAMAEHFGKVHPDGDDPRKLATQIMKDMPPEIRRHIGLE
jgi:hypothetical protein